MFQKAKELFQDAGATSKVEHAQQLMQGLHSKRPVTTVFSERL